MAAPGEFRMGRDAGLELGLEPGAVGHQGPVRRLQLPDLHEVFTGPGGRRRGRRGAVARQRAQVQRVGLGQLPARGQAPPRTRAGLASTTATPAASSARQSACCSRPVASSTTKLAPPRRRTSAAIPRRSLAKPSTSPSGPPRSRRALLTSTPR